jgi:hypothetical protein
MRGTSLKLKTWCWLAVAGLVIGGTPKGARAANFIGAEACRACHSAAFEQWASTPHARAFLSLLADQQKNGACLQCHARDVAQGGDPGVTCETCHGAGEYYWPNYVMRDHELARAAGLSNVTARDPKSCAQCHDANSPSVEPFDAAQKLPAIDHWSKDRAARSQKASLCPRLDPTKGRPVAASAPASTFLGQALRSVPNAVAPVLPAGKGRSKRRVQMAQVGSAPDRPAALASKPD